MVAMRCDDPARRGPDVGTVAYRKRRTGKAHRLYTRDPQPQVDGYEGHTLCGFVLRRAEAIAVDVVAPEDLCRVCWPATRKPSP